MHTVCTHSWSKLLARQSSVAAGLIARLLMYAHLRTALHQASVEASESAGEKEGPPSYMQRDL